ncbi:MAG: patatin-like phospholipase family protein, partial [Pseudomonadota bacterium]
MSSKSHPLVFSAGPAALEEIRSEGFDPARVGTLAGASGGAKWLVLSQLDRVIIRRLLPDLSGPVHLIGTSIGAWRFACYAQRDPLAAIERFEEAYLSQTYSAKPDRAEITAKSREILAGIFGDTGVADALTHPLFRLHVMTVRSRNLVSSESRPVLAAGLLAA